jgi:hypothetical protein
MWDHRAVAKGNRISSSGQGWERPGDPEAPDAGPEANRIALDPERERDRAAEARRAKLVRRAKLTWIFGWPPLFITAFVVSTFLHDSSADVDLPPGSMVAPSLGGTTGEWAAFLVGFGMASLWILGCIVLAFVAFIHWSES